jgi:hypothetical protein
MTAGRALLTEYIDANRAPHLVPIATAIRDHDCGFAIVLPHAGRFKLPDDKPIILTVGDDHKTCEGPEAFHRGSLRRFIKTCRAAAIVACRPIPELYRRVVNNAVYLRNNVVIVETRSEHEADWYSFLIKIKPTLAMALGSVKPEGHA